MKIIEIFEISGQLYDYIKIIACNAKFYPDPDKQAKWSHEVDQLMEIINEIKQFCSQIQLPSGTLTQQLSVNLPLPVDLSEKIKAILPQLERDEIMGPKFLNAKKIRHILLTFLESELAFVSQCHQIAYSKIKDFIEKIILTKSTHAEEKKDLFKLLSYIHKYQYIESLLSIDFKDFESYVLKPELALEHFKQFLTLVETNDALFKENEDHYLNYSLSLLLDTLDSYTTSEEDKTILSDMKIIENPLFPSSRVQAFFADINLSKLTEEIQFYFLEIQPIDRLEDFMEVQNELSKLIEHIIARIQKTQDNTERNKNNYYRHQLDRKRRQMDSFHQAMDAREHLKNPQRFLSDLRTLDQSLVNAAMTGNLQNLELALENGAWINAKSYQSGSRRETSLIIATKQKSNEIVFALVSRYLADPDRHPLDFRSQGVFNKHRRTALHWAAQTSNYDLVALLFPLDPQMLYIQDKEGNTPLHLAVLANAKDIINFFCFYCMPDIFYIKNKQDKTAFMLAFECELHEIVGSMMQYMSTLDDNQKAYREANHYLKLQTIGGRKLSTILLGTLSQTEQSLLKAAADGDLSSLKTLIEVQHVNTLVRDLGARWGNFTLLHHAADRNHLEVLRYLLSLDRTKYPLNLLAQTRFDDRHTALHLAAKQGFLEAACMLYTAEAQALYVRESIYGRTPLHCAVKIGALDLVQYFVGKEGFHILRATLFDQVTNAFRAAINENQWGIARWLWSYIKENRASGEKFYEECLGYLAVFCYLKLHATTDKRFIPILNRWMSATSEDVTATASLLWIVLQEENFNLMEFLRGAHIAIQDEGAFYHVWMAMENKMNRQAPGLSSHQSIDPQHSIQGNFLPEFLFGTRTANGKKYTWLQAERYSLAFKDVGGHAMTAIFYGMTGRNVGPDGTSSYTERAARHSSKEYTTEQVNRRGLEKYVEDTLPDLFEIDTVRYRARSKRI